MINDITMLILATTICSHSYADSIFTILEVGSDVQVNGSGTINLSGLTLNRNSASRGSLNGQLGRAIAGDGVSRNITAYKGVLTGPAPFGSINRLVLSSSGTGDPFGISGSVNEVYVPTGYVSGNSLTGTSTYSNQSLATLGLTPGTYTYAWGTGPNADSLTVRIISSETDVKSALAAGIGAVGISLDPNSLACSGTDKLSEGAVVACGFRRDGMPVGLVAKVLRIDGTAVTFDVRTEARPAPAGVLARAVATRARQHLGGANASATCPSELAPKVGTAVTCTVTAGGAKRDFNIVVDAVEGGRIAWRMQSK